MLKKANAYEINEACSLTIKTQSVLVSGVLILKSCRNKTTKERGNQMLQGIELEEAVKIITENV